LVNAESNTRFPSSTSARIVRAMVYVFPVPGGPWISAPSSASTASETASFWDALLSM